jgi:hypothetical protein
VDTTSSAEDDRKFFDTALGILVAVTIATYFLARAIPIRHSRPGAWASVGRSSPGCGAEL